MTDHIYKQQKKLDRIFELESGLSTWEMDFCESIATRLEEGKELTDKQDEILTRIYDEKVLGS